MKDANASLHLPKRDRWIAYALLLALAYFPLFMNLDALPLRTWDESRQAVSAYEMLHNGNWFVNHVGGRPDMWSTKPPLLVWLQAIGMALIGPGELAVRLPSAISALFICLLLVRFTSKQLGSPWPGLFASLVILTSHGFVNMHVARSGDYDALLTLFMLWAAISAFRYADDGSRNAVLSMFAALALGVLTKSIQAVMMVPGIIIWWIAAKRLLPALKDRWFWIGLVGFAILVGGFYLLRESRNPGYLLAVWENDMGGRYGHVHDGHRANGFFYIDNLQQDRFPLWYLWSIAGAVIGMAGKDAMLRRIAGFSTLLSVQYLLVISNAATKLDWYDAPLYPLLGILAAIPIHLLFAWCRESAWLKERLNANVASWTLMACLFFTPYLNIAKETYIPKEYDWDRDFYALQRYLQQGAHGKRTVDVGVVCYEAYDAHVLFYTYLLTERGQTMEILPKEHLKPGMKVVASEQHVKDHIEQHYMHSVTLDEPPVKVYSIEGVKP
ncbi:MAG: glycosyltransferase family 39 protein [Flavobacteriales bacterium]